MTKLNRVELTEPFDFEQGNALKVETLMDIFTQTATDIRWKNIVSSSQTLIVYLV